MVGVLDRAVFVRKFCSNRPIIFRVRGDFVPTKEHFQCWWINLPLISGPGWNFTKNLKFKYKLKCYKNVVSDLLDAPGSF